jgi:putative SOS response-associated peptidase YedK
MCTKAVAVDVRAMSQRLQASVVSPQRNPYHSQSNKVHEGDVLPTDLAPVITHQRPYGIQYMRWGLIPAFATDPKQISPMFNARAETLTELRSFRDLIMSSRCLILNKGFYENETQGNDKVQWKISPVEEYFYKAGLWTTWRNGHTGEVIESFTMITCDPSGHSFSKIHNRMPIILNKAERRLWMNPNSTKNQLLGLLKPCAEEMYTTKEYSRKSIKVSKRSSKPDGGTLLF